MSNRAERGSGISTCFVLSAILVCLLFITEAQAAAARAKAAGSGAPRILVLPFNVRQEDGRQEADSSFAQLMGRRLTASGAAVIPHERMLALIKARRIDSLDPAAVRSLAASAGAAYAVYGSVNISGSSMSIDARLAPAGAARSPVPVFVELDGGTASMPTAADQLASAILAELPRPGAPDPGGAVIAGIEVRGTLVLDPDVVLMRISTRKGDKPDAAAIDQEVKQIWDLGYFSDVQVTLEPRPDGLWAVYTVKEKPRLESVTFTGNSELDDDDLLAVMGNKAGSILNEKLLADDIQKILEAYRKEGYYLATVDQHVDVRPGSNSAALNLSINEGKKLYISEVRLDGCEQLDAGDVQDQLLLSERSIISWITGTGVLKEELIERDSSAITAYYLDRGFMDVTVAAPKIDYTEDGIVVTFPIHEGPRYTLGNITFAGDLIDTEERLKEETGMDEMASSGAWFNLTQMQSDVKKLTEFYADYGYAFADVEALPRKRADGSDTVDIVFSIARKNRYHVRRVTVEGNIKTRDNVILREMRLTDGEQFQGDKLRRSTERLNKLGYFEVAEVELSPTENADEVDLKVKVKEKPTGALMAGVGYSTFSRVGVAATIMERNLWGKGYNVSLQAAFSARRNAYTLSMGNPRWNDTDLSVGMDVYHWRDDYIDFTKRTTGAVVRFAYPLGEYTSFGWGYRLDEYEIYDTNQYAARLIRDYADGVRYTSVGLARLVRDSTDRENPTSGNIDILGVEYGGGLLGGDDSFITLSAEHQSYYQLWPEHVLHGRIKGMAILKNGKDEVPVFERFWMGGMNTVRGYDSEDIVPRDPETGDRIGGTRMAFMNLEYIYTLSNEAGLYLVPFYDMGFNVDADRSYSWNREMLKSAGLEVRWRSPMGDLRFSYGIPFDEDRNGNKSSGRFEFSMGQTF
ncbi:MAG: outer membrane protein assembly factor BamA [Desulfovibrio sp.]|jgi:outer membrane protein insertion porin family|nr:outer membrane protein assembly factor BamA [Desulfovibrio sp.]